jgi:hypothetical protein
MNASRADTPYASICFVGFEHQWPWAQCQAAALRGCMDLFAMTQTMYPQTLYMLQIGVNSAMVRIHVSTCDYDVEQT